MEDNDDVVQTLIFMDFEVAGKLLETEFGGDLQPRNMAGLNETVYLRRLLESDVDMSRVPRIAEMSFVFVPRSLFVEAAENMHFKLKRQEDGGEPGPICIELAANVFTSQLNPELSDEDWALYEQKRASIRLRRTELESKNTFAQEWPAVHHLLSVCPKPACLVAHNGLAFDFRILMHELDRCGLLRRHPIPEGVFFLDSYLTFVDIEREHHATIRKTLDTIDWNVIRAAQPTTAIPHATSNQPKESPPLLQIDEEAEKEQQKIREEKQRREEEEDEIECLGGDCPLFENTPPSPACSSVIATDEEETREDQQQQSKCGDNDGSSPAAEPTAQKSGVANGFAQMEAEEEITFIEEKKCDETEEEEISRRRKRRRLLSTATVIGRQRGPSAAGNGLLLFRKRPHFVSPLDSLEPSHPFRFLRRCEWCPAKRLRIPAHIFEKDADGQWCFSEASSALLTDGGGKFKLGNIFRKVIGTDFRAHRAQADSEALLQVALAYGDDFLAHLNTKRAPFPKTTTAGILPPTVEC